jgi:hypothetical protein
MRAMLERGTPRSLTKRCAMVRTLAWLSLRLPASSTAGLPLALSGPSDDVHPSSAKEAWVARAFFTQGVRSRLVFAASISLAVLTTK